MKKLAYDEFKREIEKSDSIKFNFWELFDVRCRRCGSDKIEMGGECELENSYYGESWIKDNSFIIKCHKCGNAKVFKMADYYTEMRDGHE